MSNQQFHALVNQIRESKNLELLQQTAEKCYEYYLNKIITSDTYHALCRMIVERFVNLSVKA